MNRRIIVYIMVISSVLFFIPASAQNYSLNGSATQNSCNCYTLTPDKIMGQTGSVWNNNKIDLRQPFDFWFNVFLGCNDNGADGMVFILQRMNTSVGRSGSGLGFAGVTPSVGIALDTYQNIDPNVPENSLNDPLFDHISIQINGQVAHGNDLAGPVPVSASSNNVEDCQWHKLRITWDPATRWMRSYFDDVLRVEAQVDMVNDIFKNDPLVYWGFSAATGGEYNLQQFCTALNPGFTMSVANNRYCPGDEINFTDKSVSFAPIKNYYWNFGDGSTSHLKNPLPHVYTQPGNYQLKMAIQGLDGCNSDTLSHTVTIGSIPDAGFLVFDTCFKKQVRLLYNESSTGVTNKWFINNNEVNDVASFNNLTAGPYLVKRIATSDYGCGTDEEEMQLNIKPIPQIAIDAKDGCVDEEISMNGVQLDAATIIDQWHWQFQSGQTANTQKVFQHVSLAGNYTHQLFAVANNGCSSDTVFTTIHFEKPFAFAGADTLVLKNIPFQLKGSGNGNYQWSPSTGLSNNAIANPDVVLNDDQAYVLTITTPEGCVAKDSVTITVFKGAAIYVPSGFTPNGDGLNEYFKPRYVGIKSLQYFTVFNRWGQQVFHTTDTGKSWDGTMLNKMQAAGTYIWMVQATDYEGHVHQLKGSVNLVK